MRTPKQNFNAMFCSRLSARCNTVEARTSARFISSTVVRALPHLWPELAGKIFFDPPGQDVNTLITLIFAEQIRLIYVFTINFAQTLATSAGVTQPNIEEGLTVFFLSTRKDICVRMVWTGVTKSLIKYRVRPCCSFQQDLDRFWGRTGGAFPKVEIIQRVLAFSPKSLGSIWSKELYML